ncbi:mucin-2-like [Ochlerotatus camptorhynchus]|uniref:mucin-2-like n=1 Tax=Ochlerotatus camptorhynchus TaxID=644619 RepID=UPI0031DD1DE3
MYSYPFAKLSFAAMWKLFVVLLSLAAIVAVAENNSECTIEFVAQYGSMFAIPGSCEKFLACRAGKMEELNCPTGMLFDVESSRCIGERQAKCLTENWSAADGLCDSDGVYVHPDPHSCARYVICLGEKPLPGHCSPGLLFDSANRHCDVPINAVCNISCPSEDDEQVYLPDSTGQDCARYSICKDGIPHPAECPSMMYFDRLTKTCVLPENASCRIEGVTCSEQDEYVDNPKSCSSYYACEAGFPHLRECGTGLDFIDGMCVIASGDCDDLSTDETENTTEVDPSTTHMPSTPEISTEPSTVSSTLSEPQTTTESGSTSDATTVFSTTISEESSTMDSTIEITSTETQTVTETEQPTTETSGETATQTASVPTTESPSTVTDTTITSTEQPSTTESTTATQTEQPTTSETTVTQSTTVSSPQPSTPTTESSTVTDTSTEEPSTVTPTMQPSTTESTSPSSSTESTTATQTEQTTTSVPPTESSTATDTTVDTTNTEDPSTATPTEQSSTTESTSPSSSTELTTATQTEQTPTLVPPTESSTVTDTTVDTTNTEEPSTATPTEQPSTTESTTTQTEQTTAVTSNPTTDSSTDAQSTTSASTSASTTDAITTSTLTPTTTIDPADICRDVDIGVVPHPYNCYQYFVCIFGSGREVSCSHGHIFDYQSLLCVPGDRATCTSTVGALEHVRN